MYKYTKIAACIAVTFSLTACLEVEDKNNESIASNQVIADLKATLDTVEQSFSDISRKMQNTQDEYDAYKSHPEHQAYVKDFWLVQVIDFLEKDTVIYSK